MQVRALFCLNTLYGSRQRQTGRRAVLSGAHDLQDGADGQEQFAVGVRPPHQGVSAWSAPAALGRVKVVAGVLKRDFFHGGEVILHGKSVRYRVPSTGGAGRMAYLPRTAR